MKVYIINMETSTARREAMTAQLRALGLSYEIVPAVDGRKYTREQLSDIVFDVNEFTGAQTGCMLSHCKVYERMQQQREEFALIFEDDSLITERDFTRLMEQAIQAMPKDYVLLLTYYWCREGNLNLSLDKRHKLSVKGTEYHIGTPHEVHGVGRAGAYVLSKESAAKILAFHKPRLQCQADSWTVYHRHGLIGGLSCMYPMPVTENPQFGSEIGYNRNGLEKFVKAMAEQAVLWNVPVVADMIRKKRIRFSESYKNIVAR